MAFSKKLASLRKQAGLSQEELAGRISVSRQAVSRWESGRAVPEAPYIVAISRVFGVSTDFLLLENSDATAFDGKKEPETSTPVVVVAHPRTLPLLFWLGALLLLVGVAGVLTLLVLSLQTPWTAEVDSRVYTGLLGFLYGNGAVWALVLACVLVGVGLALCLGCSLAQWKKCKSPSAQQTAGGSSCMRR